MCTVTFIPQKDGFILTASRDERTDRPFLKPKAYIYKNRTLIYPKDELAGGTWIAASHTKKIACLLNGGFKNHVKKTHYDKSRGLILLESFYYGSHHEFLKGQSLINIEPFTLLLIDFESGVNFLQLIWDGKTKHISKVDNNTCKIWSSATLYSQNIREIRQKWFEAWVVKNNEMEDCNILDFHKGKQSIHDENAILMKRKNGLETVSISQISTSGRSADFLHYDLINTSNTKIILSDIPCTQVSQ